MIDINELRRLAQANYESNSVDSLYALQGAFDYKTVLDLLDRLEAAENDVALKERVIDALGSELNAVANERDALRAKIVANGEAGAGWRAARRKLLRRRAAGLGV